MPNGIGNSNYPDGSDRTVAGKFRKSKQRFALRH